MDLGYVYVCMYVCVCVIIIIIIGIIMKQQVVTRDVKSWQAEIIIVALMINRGRTQSPH